MSCLLLPGCAHFDNDVFDAITKNDIGSVDHLLKKGIDINKKDVEGRTPLFLAAYLGEKDIVHLLVKNGAFVNAKTTNQNTALMAACRNRHSNVVKVLLASNADIAIKDDHGETALDHARRAGAEDIVAMLEGAAVMKKDVGGKKLLPTRYFCIPHSPLTTYHSPSFPSILYKL
jgi:uncharacterized protein